MRSTQAPSDGSEEINLPLKLKRVVWVKKPDGSREQKTEIVTDPETIRELMLKKMNKEEKKKKKKREGMTTLETKGELSTGRQASKEGLA